MMSGHRILAVGLLVLVTSRAEAQTTPAKDKEREVVLRKCEPIRR
jgi:hypothetical protein